MGVVIDLAAQVSVKAELGENVRIGPNCYVGPHVVLGDGCWLQSMVRIDGWTTVGKDCRFFHGAVVGSEPQDLKFKGGPTRLRVGNSCVFREYCTINRATFEGEETALGDRNLIMAYAHIAHNCQVHSDVILGNSVNLAGHVTVEDFAIISGVTPVHQFTRIGQHCIIGGGSRVPKDVAPFVKAAGNPLRNYGLNSVGLQRRGFSPEVQAALKKVYRIFFRSGLRVEEALKRIRTELPNFPEAEAFCHFAETSKRGITR
ncbi:MAG: acyl-ACP--UDP-N-acetylglucosamine O-acyltransferase [Candidatus Eisenbacteria bacterium]|uniref:Acyl-ACP--UDP-N-acetylglucosamine O-acyltransferase n=1 Tax=Eiseniibacteriota bacterium TaxID=2212470 RepID=A0A948RVD9_UNCEI|nr:acyl-ACP--UDP-N-acetylglucosamine O-acyltransferase [Candidatus Eisenbacteria bacterium]MBU1949232.1 acyl-ACP--UDP-N-acetylglucosamine O-acyltransferase [Candidatus Eisenbacteria bacterium]MBU2690268.1 acyl-ACP--UDP-N-acetylglucosamine O-acyltransferase [Candidatus Eisenbacteria bacterium]